MTGTFFFISATRMFSWCATPMFSYIARSGGAYRFGFVFMTVTACPLFTPGTISPQPLPETALSGYRSGIIISPSRIASLPSSTSHFER